MGFKMSDILYNLISSCDDIQVLQSANDLIQDIIESQWYSFFNGTIIEYQRYNNLKEKNLIFEEDFIVISKTDGDMLIKNKRYTMTLSNLPVIIDMRLLLSIEEHLSKKSKRIILWIGKPKTIDDNWDDCYMVLVKDTFIRK